MKLLIADTAVILMHDFVARQFCRYCKAQYFAHEDISSNNLGALLENIKD